MSIWTHVNGNIRLDEFASRNINTIKSILGKMKAYKPETSGLSINDFSDNDNDILLPCGSEGSIKYSILSNKDLSNLEAHSISIWGDLRDYEDIEEINSWFNNLLNTFMKNNFFIRNACLEIEVEYGLHIVLIADCYNIDYENKTISIKIINIE